jgi:hypothetical protein
LAAGPLDRVAPADARAPERLAAVDRERDEEPVFVRLPELAFEREEGAALPALAPDLLRPAPAPDLLRGPAPEPELFVAALEPPVGLRDEVLEPLDFREEALEPEAEPRSLAGLPLPERAEPERAAAPDEPEADEPLLEPDDVRFLAVLRRFAPLSFSTAILPPIEIEDQNLPAASRRHAGQEKPAIGLPDRCWVYTRDDRPVG